MKKSFVIIGLFVLSSLPLIAYAQGFVPLAPIPGLTDIQPTERDLADFLNNLYKYLVGLAATLAVVMIIWGGLEYSTQDVPGAKKNGKDRILGAILGLVLVLSPVLVFSIINPSILNLSINLPKLDTRSGGGGTNPNTQTPAETAAAIAAGCTVTGTLLKTAICTTQTAAQNFATACSTGSGNVPFFTTDHKATCDTRSGSITGSYSFADTSSGVLATIFGYSNYQPLASTPTNPNNGSAVMQFASSCTTDKGTTCMGAIKLPCATSIVQVITSGSSPTTSCWNISLSCTSGSTGAGGCSSSPNFTIVQTK